MDEDGVADDWDKQPAAFSDFEDQNIVLNEIVAHATAAISQDLLILFFKDIYFSRQP